jgi:hypothetical protein
LSHARCVDDHIATRNHDKDGREQRRVESITARSEIELDERLTERIGNSTAALAP